jgi:hypothetical protein
MLSESEAEYYFADDNARLANMPNGSGGMPWWLRTTVVNLRMACER